MDDLQQAAVWLLLQRMEGFGPRRINNLLEYFSSPVDFFNASRDELADLPDWIQTAQQALQNPQHPLHKQVEKDLEYLQQQDIHLLTLGSPEYPPLLAQIDCPPPVLYVKGDNQLLQEPQLAVVGARRAGKPALQSCFDWCAALADAGLVITSGLALGVDAAAHQGALSVGQPTIAVLGHGIDTLYPQQHEAMAEEIARCGALVTEFPLGVKARRDHFPRRNRIISGLSLGVWVVEAAIRSGSLITAQYAIEQNREVFAMPGSVNNPLAEGCHHLIKQGAYLVDRAEDIAQVLGWQHRHCCENDAQKQNSPQLEAEDASLLALIPFEAIHLDDILADFGGTAAELSIRLIQLELAGLVENRGGNYLRIR